MANAAGKKIVSDNGTDGTSLGRDAAELVGLHGAVSSQQNTTGGIGFVNSGSGSTIFANTQFSGAVDGGYYTISDIITALKDKGILDPNGGAPAA